MMNDDLRETTGNDTPLHPDSMIDPESRFDENMGSGSPDNNALPDSPGTRGKKKRDIDAWLEKITRLIDFF